MESENTQAEGKGAREPAARRPTIDHVTLQVRDLPASRRFYEAALAPLSFGLEFEHEGLVAFGSWESGRLIIYASERRAGAEAQVLRRLLRRLRVRP